MIKRDYLGFSVCLLVFRFHFVIIYPVISKSVLQFFFKLKVVKWKRGTENRSLSPLLPEWDNPRENRKVTPGS